MRLSLIIMTTCLVLAIQTQAQIQRWAGSSPSVDGDVLYLPPQITKPTTGFDVTVKVSLDEALAIHAALITRPLSVEVNQTIQQAVQQIVANTIASLVDQGESAEANEIKADLRGMSRADRDAIKAEIVKRRKKP